MSLAHQESCRTCRKAVEVVLQRSVIARSCVPSVGDHLIIHGYHHVCPIKLHCHMGRLAHSRSRDLIACRLVASNSVHSRLPVPALRRVISYPRTVADVCPAVYDREIRAAAVRSSEIRKIRINLTGSERL